MEFLATTSFAMEGVLKNELTLLGFEVERTTPGLCLFAQISMLSFGQMRVFEARSASS